MDYNISRDENKNINYTNCLHLKTLFKNDTIYHSRGALFGKRYFGNFRLGRFMKYK